MSEEQQQSLNEVATHPDTVPPVAHYQATMPRDYAVSSTYQVSLYDPQPVAVPDPRCTGNIPGYLRTSTGGPSSSL